VSAYSTCPFCGTSRRNRPALCRLNRRVLAHNALCLVAWLFHPWSGVIDGGVQIDFWPLLRVCGACRRRFFPRVPAAYRTICWQCEYDLTGNRTGVCPECGQPLAESQRAALANT
jgi:hypothetical protein